MYFIIVFYLERRRRTALHYIKKRKGKIPENTKQHKDTTQHQTHTGTHILALTHPPPGFLNHSRLLTSNERKNDHQRPSFHSTDVEAVRKEIPWAPAIDLNFLSSLDRIRARATSGAALSKTQLFRWVHIVQALRMIRELIPWSTRTLQSMVILSHQS